MIEPKNARAFKKNKVTVKIWWLVKKYQTFTCFFFIFEDISLGQKPYKFVDNLFGFPMSQNLLKLVKYWPNYAHFPDTTRDGLDKTGHNF